jgi:hypothetical protein
VIDKERHVGRSPAQRRHRHDDRAHPIEQVPAEAPVSGLAGQVLGGGRHDADVDVEDTLLADPPELAGVEDAQQPHLHGR